jgi:MarR family transcriptional regulator, transcriptional regulator for hemolysin
LSSSKKSSPRAVPATVRVAAVKSRSAADSSENFGFLLTQLSRRYVRRFERRAQRLSLTLVQCKTLIELETNQGLSQAKMAELADVEPMTMVRIIDHMEASGLLERRPDPTDRRARRLYLTPKAKPLLSQIWRIAEQGREEAFEGIGAQQRDSFIDVLERIYTNVCAVDGERVKRTLVGSALSVRASRV